MTYLIHGKSMRFLFGSLLLILVLFSMVGCFGTPGEEEVSDTEDLHGPVSFPFTWKDDLGRKVVITKFPKKIVSLAPSHTEVLFAIGAGPQVVGVTNYCNYPEAAKKLPRVGGFAGQDINLEKVVSLEPDAVLAVGKIQKIAAERLARLGLTVIVVEPKSFSRMYRNILLIGKIAGKQKQAQALVDSLRKRVDKIKARVSHIPAEKRLRVFYQVWDSPLMTANQNTRVGEMIEMAGGINLFADHSVAYPQINKESLFLKDPEVIFFPSSHNQKFKIPATWNGLTAVKKGRIYTIDADRISRPGPRLVDALEKMASKLYPEEFK